MAEPFRTHLLSIARQRCPRCHQGRAFRSLLVMHDACPVCGHIFEREPGYFVGAMYVSYALAIPVYLALAGVLRLFLRGWRSEERRVGKECRSRWSPYH